MEVTNPIALALISIVFAVVIYFVIRHMRRVRSELKPVIAQFMEAGAARNVEAAYACCSHYSPTKEDVVELIERSYDAFRDYKRFTISVHQWHSDENITEAYVAGTVIYAGRRKQPFKFSLMQENDGWKIAGVQIGSVEKGVVTKVAPERGGEHSDWRRHIQNAKGVDVIRDVGMGALYLSSWFVAWILVLVLFFRAILPLFLLTTHTLLFAAFVIFFIFLLVPPLMALGIRFLVTRALERGRAMFSRGKISIEIQKTDYSPGDTIWGHVVLALKSPVKAKGMSIFLVAEETTWGGDGILGLILSRGNLSVRWERRRIYDHEQLLDGENEYSEGREYHFATKVPGGTPGTKSQMPEPQGMLGEALKVPETAAGIAGLTPLRDTPEPEGKQNRWLEIAKEIAAAAGLITVQRVQWYLLAKLDIPQKLDISKKVKVTIG